MQHGVPWLDYLLFLTVAYSPSIVRWAISAICVPRIVYRITGPRIAGFFFLNIVQQGLVAFSYPYLMYFGKCVDNEGWCKILPATIAIGICETVLSLGWIAAAVIRRRRN